MGGRLLSVLRRCLEKPVYMIETRFGILGCFVCQYIAHVGSRYPTLGADSWVEQLLDRLFCLAVGGLVAALKLQHNLHCLRAHRRERLETTQAQRRMCCASSACADTGCLLARIALGDYSVFMTYNLFYIYFWRLIASRTTSTSVFSFGLVSKRRQMSPLPVRLRTASFFPARFASAFCAFLRLTPSATLRVPNCASHHVRASSRCRSRPSELSPYAFRPKGGIERAGRQR